MNKSIVAVFVVLVLAAVAGVGYYLVQNIDAIVKDLVEQVGSDVTGTSVSVTEVSVDLAAGQATITGLAVANPPGFSAGPLFAMDEIAVTIDTASLTQAVYVIDEIAVTGVRVLAEQKGTGTNVQALIDGMPDESPGEGASGETDSGDTRLAIGSISFADGSMELRSDQFETQTIELKELRLRQLGDAENGLTPDEMGREIASQLLGQVRDAVKDAVKDYLREESKARLKEKLGEKLGDLFNRD